MKTFSVASFIFLITGFTSFSQAQSVEMDLDTMKWKNRIVIAFAPDSSSTSLLDLKSDVEDQKAAFLNRDLKLIVVLERGVSTIDGVPISAGSVSRLNERFEVDFRSFRVYLIGKDGRAKLEGDETTRLAEIFALIDTMPMRRAEMKRKANGS